ncbi:hypothetical protein [Streptomyces cinereoruber]|uniref:hypothetical protein n=1 Tax=Streptomyces cinereoruber TaxID=67260 RepID=UPI00363177E8
MSHELPNVQHRPYREGRFSASLPYAPTGYLFTVPGNFPQDAPAHLNVTDQEMAAYWTYGQWEVRDLTPARRVWGTGRSRRTAVGLALQEIARKRRQEAREIAERRQAIGLEAVPPYAVEVTGSVTLLCTPEAIGVLARIFPGDDPAEDVYHGVDPEGGEPYAVHNSGRAVLQHTTAGVLHHRCGCDPEDAIRFENETDALKWAGRLTHYWRCTKRPA